MADGDQNVSFNYKHPERFDFKSPESWENWFKRFKRFRNASGLSSKPEELQINTLICSMEPEAKDIIASFGLADDDSKKWANVMDKLKAFYTQKKCYI